MGENTQKQTADFVKGVATYFRDFLETDFKIGEDDETKIDFADANTINFHANNAKEMVLVENALTPGTSDGTALGTTSLMWSDLFLASGAVMNFNNGNVTITHSTNTLTVAAATVAFTASTAVTVSNDLKLSSDSAILSLGADDDATLTHDGTTGLIIAANPFEVDSGGNITLDAHTGIFIFQDANSEVLRITEGNSGDVTIKLETNGKDLIFTDNGDATGLTIKDAAAGIVVPGEVMTTKISFTDGDDAITIADGGGTTFAQDATFSGNITIADSKGIIIDSTPTDNGFNGIFASFDNATGATINQGEVVYITGTANQVAKARANADSTMPAVAIATADVANGASGNFMLHGIVHDSSKFPALTIGGEVYVSEDTAGLITSTLPASSGDRVQVIGIGLHGDKMLFNPSYDIVERG